jgi:hypothetical protein
MYTKENNKSGDMLVLLFRHIRGAHALLDNTALAPCMIGYRVILKVTFLAQKRKNKPVKM